MIESTLTQSFLRKLRTAEGAVVLKHRDASTIGIPDASYSRHGFTWWFEFKMVKTNTRRNSFDFSKVLVHKNDVVQLEVMVALERATRGRAAYVVFVVNGSKSRFYLAMPSLVKKSFLTKVPISLGIEATLEEMETWTK